MIEEEQKEALRKTAKASRLELTAQEKLDRTQALFTHAAPFFQKAELIHTFLPITRLNEINTLGLISSFPNKKWICSEVVGTRLLKHWCITKDTRLSEDKWGIPTPIDGSPFHDLHRIDLVLVPLLAADYKGNRIGYGKGFYDAFLRALPSSCIFLGLNYFDPIREEIPTNTFDVPIDNLASPTGIFNFSSHE